ncbi:hypothetical protein N005_25965 [Pseudomonas mediterranea CFBP 5447]|jgi:hypothetical protein|nr:hypothetical protein N005_25965 [Pseudomonas mediterranea CFBP 5447]
MGATLKRRDKGCGGAGYRGIGDLDGEAEYRSLTGMRYARFWMKAEPRVSLVGEPRGSEARLINLSPVPLWVSPRPKLWGLTMMYVRG